MICRQIHERVVKDQTITIGNFYIELLLHSVNPVGKEVLTFQWTYNRDIHAEVMTHRWSRNYSSSRAIPYEKMQAWIAEDPALPIYVGQNQGGMQSGEEVANVEEFYSDLLMKQKEMAEWQDMMVRKYNPHKEIINRFGEPWGWITGVATMGLGQYINFLGLRANAMANCNIQRLAINSLRLYKNSVPQVLDEGMWHMPYFQDYIPEGPIDSRDVQHALTWSTARCAWVSYNNPTKDATLDKALVRHNDCIMFKHATPLEHQNQARCDDAHRGLVPGYDSYRMMVPGEVIEKIDMDAILAEYGDKDYLKPPIKK